MSAWEWGGVVLVAVFVAYISRLPLVRRITNVEAAMTTMQGQWKEEMRKETDRAIDLARAGFKADVKTQLGPISKQLSDQDETLGQIRTQVSRLVNERGE